MPYIPYCGAPPVPGQTAWNTDPFLAAALLALGGVYLAGCRRAGGGGPAPDGREQACFAAGSAILALALVSPLCNLTVALFSARVGQHMLLTLIAAPLVALGRPELASARLLGQHSRRRPQPTPRLVAGTLSFAILLWLWHMPAPYAATLAGDLAYWAMHGTLFASAVLLWHALLVAGREKPEGAFVAGIVTAMQMSLLSAVLTFARQPLFAFHETTTWPWGLSPLEDQQLGGLIMWVPGGALFMAAGLLALAAWLRQLGAGRTPAGLA